MAFNQILTEKFKKIVRFDPNYLYDTGALWSSIKVDLSMVGGNILVAITCEDYIKFHIEKYGLTGQLKMTKEFKDELNTIAAPWMTVQFRTFILTGKEPQKMKVKITYNGK